MPKRVMIKCRRDRISFIVYALGTQGFVYDAEYGIVSAHDDEDIVMIRGTIEENKIPDLRFIPGFVSVHSDVEMEPFGPVQD